MWRGPAAADVAAGPALQGLSVYLEEKQLRSLVVAHPLNESFHIRLMEALHHTGRRGDALVVYRELCRTLDDELGMEPSPEARSLQYEILVSR